MEVKIKGQKELHQEVRDAKLCTGCGACVNLCPYQAAYQDEVITLHACDLKEGGCHAFCPRTPADLDVMRNRFFDPKDLTPEVGAVKAFYITRAASSKLREGGQHGGTVTALMSLALKEGLIDTAVVAEDEGNLLPHGAAVADAAGIENRGRSRFVVSPGLAEFNRVAKAGGKKIGVVATPCQALALAKMKMKPLPAYADRIDQLKLVVGLFCGWALSWRNLSALLRTKLDLGEIVGMDIPPSKFHILQVYTKKGCLEISLDEINPCVRKACWVCPDLTAEFSDISVGSARLEEGWDEARNWNQVIVRTAAGERLLQLAKDRKVLEFQKVPEGNLPKLKTASMGKKKAAVKNLASRSGDPEKLFYLDPADSVLKTLIHRPA